jgi:hypothetical protein
MEYTVAEEYNKEKNILRKKMITECLKRDVVDIYKSVDNKFTRIHISDTNLTSFETKSIRHIITCFTEWDRFLCLNREEAVFHLMKLNDNYKCIKNMWNIFYYDSRKLDTELQDFAHIYVSRLYSNIISVPYDKNEVDNFLDRDSIGMMECSLENSNGRVYLCCNNEKHHMDYDNTVNTMFDSKENVACNITSKYDRINLLRISMGFSPIRLFGHFELIERCKLMIAISQICKDINLPVRDDITNFMYKEHGYLRYTNFFESKLKQISSNVVIDNFKKHEFEDLNQALAFIIYLCINKENYILLYGKRYTVCYNSDISYSTVHSVHQMKQHIGYFLQTNQNSHNSNIIYNAELIDLFKYKVIRGNIVDTQPVHINPYDNIPLPLSYYSFEGIRLRCISGLSRPAIPYDRADINIENIDISFSDDHIVFGDKVCNEKFPKELHDIVTTYATALWAKGYFLTVHGLMWYIETEKILNHCIYLPPWFTIKNSNKQDFKRFIEFNFSEYLEDS